MLRYRYHLVAHDAVPLAWMARAACRWTAAKLGLADLPPLYFYLPDGDTPVAIPRPELEAYVARLEAHVAGGPPPETFSSAKQSVGFIRDNAPGIYLRADLDSFETIRTAIHETVHVWQKVSGNTGWGREAWAHQYQDEWLYPCFNALDAYCDPTPQE